MTFALTRRSTSLPVIAAPPVQVRMPDRKPGPGEQYRFHFDMRKCIACKCCVVACNEQNGNPSAVTWRRVGEIEGGWFPLTSRSYLSMGCNHCLEPTCLQGCPVDAYTKDAVTGIVSHSAEACIGCQYCTWNCSYGVPQYNAERGVVGKCDMCHGRLSLGQAPACVSACPQGAIEIELVTVAEWRRALDDGTAGTPSGDGSLSTTRVTPGELAPNAHLVATDALRPEHPHWPLVMMTVLTQLSVGGFATIWLLQLLGSTSRLVVAALASLMVGGLALTAATFHLGRPVYAYRALRMWRRSWLSREVLLFAAFSGAAAAYAAALWLASAGDARMSVAAALLGAATVLLGAAGVTASACIYRVPSRPAWNSPFTLIQFGLTAGVLGPLFAAAMGLGDHRWLAVAAVAGAAAQLLAIAVGFVRMVDASSAERRATARLLSTVLAPRFVVRGTLLAFGGIVLPLTGTDAATAGIALVAAVVSEILGRYLFFVSVVPKHLAAPYVAATGEAA